MFSQREVQKVSFFIEKKESKTNKLKEQCIFPKNLQTGNAGKIQ